MSIGDVVRVYWAPTSTPLSTSPTWTEITNRVRHISLTSGRSAAFDLYQPATATIVIGNQNGTINTTSWWRWRQVKVEVVAGGGTTVLYKGFIQEVDHDQSAAPFDATATLVCEDVLSILSRKELAMGGPYGTDVPKEPTSDRVDRILTEAAIPAGFISTIQSSTILMSQPKAYVNDVETAGVLVGNALELLQSCVECEMGALFTNSGLLRYENRYSLVDRTITPGSYPTFSDTPTGSQIPFLRGDVILVPSGTDYRNVVSFTPSSGNVKSASSIPSGFPSDTLSYTVPLAVDQQALGNAQGLLEVYQQQKIWPQRISIQTWPDRGPMLSWIKTLNVRDYAVVQFTPANGSQQTYKTFVAGITHEIVPGFWNTTIEFESADRWYTAWGGTTFLVLNSATAGQLNQETLAY